MKSLTTILGVLAGLAYLAAAQTSIRAQDETPADPAARVVSLLEKVDPKSYAEAGRWEYVGGVLVTDGRKPSRLSFPYFPPQEYDYIVEFTISAPGTCVAFLVSRGDVPFTWSLNTRGQMARLEDINGHAVIGNPTFRKHPLESWKNYVAEVRVRESGVTCVINGKAVLDEFQTDYSNLSRNGMWNTANPLLLGVGAWGPTFLHRVEVREITGQGRWD